MQVLNYMHIRTCIHQEAALLWSYGVLLFLHEALLLKYQLLVASCPQHAHPQGLHHLCSLCHGMPAAHTLNDGALHRYTRARDQRWQSHDELVL